MGRHPIPSTLLDSRVAIVGTSGSGKTHTALGMAELLLEDGARVCMVDALGVCWGLRSNAAGDGPGYPVVIFGGRHADVPINEAAAKPLAGMVAEGSFSAVLDLSELGSLGARRRFMRDFLEGLYAANKDPLHLILDEADLWAPQKPIEPAAAILQARVDEVVRRGRVRGFIPWLITQRPAVLSKDVLSQADVLIAMKLTSSQDRNAIGAWIEGQADREEGKRILAALPSLPVGEGYVWAPGVGMLDRVAFPRNRTFDSSRTPKRGERRRAPTSLAEIDTDAMRAALSEAVAEAAENDPKALRSRIAELERQVKAKASDAKAHALIEAARTEGYAEGLRDGRQQAVGLMRSGVDALVSTLDRMHDAPRPVTSPEFATVTSPQVKHEASVCVSAQVGKRPARTGAELRILKVLAQRHPARFTEAQWATLAGMKRTGGTWGTYKSRLRTAGYLEEGDGLFGCSAAGLEAAGELPPGPQTPEEVQAMWRAAVGGGAARMLDALIAAFPAALSRTELADRLGMAATGGSFGTYLSRLKSNGLVEVEGRTVKASAILWTRP